MLQQQLIHHLNRAFQEHQKGHLQPALATYQTLLAQGLNTGSLSSIPPWHDGPSMAEFLLNLGYKIANNGWWEPAKLVFETVRQLQPQNIDALNNLAVCHAETGHHENAKQTLSEILKKSPARVDTLNNLGLCCQMLEQTEEALNAFTRAIQLNPMHTETLSNLASLYAKQKKWDDAISYYMQALQFKDTDIRLFNNLVHTWLSAGQEDVAHRYSQRMWPANSPDYDIYWGEIHEGRQELPKAIDWYQRALTKMPDSLWLLEKLVDLYGRLGEIAQVIHYTQTSMQIDPQNARIHSRLLFTLAASPDYTQAEQRQHFESWNEHFAKPLLPEHLIYPHQPAPNRRLKVGYVSGDFTTHSATFAFHWLFQFHDRSQFEIYTYANQSKHDAYTDWFKQRSDHWRLIEGWEDEAVTQQIKHDEIDILVDLSGHTVGNRLLVFARKPAPIQITGLGFGQTTGITAMDYRFSDRFISPPNLLNESIEPIICLTSLVQWTPPPLAMAGLELQPPPLLKQGFLTLGCGNNPFKLNAAVWTTWSELLRQLPQARLHLKYRDLDIPAVQDHFRQKLAQLGIDPERLIFSGQTSPRDHLAFYQGIDLALDPFPYNGGSSTCDALWMGVPVIALAGGMRAGEAILNQMGHPEWIATSPEGYVQTALELAQQPELLAQLRMQLREALSASAICQPHQFVREIEFSYRQAWARWCQQTIALPELGERLGWQIDIDELLTVMGNLSRQQPENSNLFALLGVHQLYQLNNTPADIQAHFAQWVKRYAQHLIPLAPHFENDPAPERKLRIGYVSADFRQHSVSHNFSPFFEWHNRDTFEVWAYANQQDDDDITDYFKMRSDHWVNVWGMAAQALADMIRSHQIDILVDLSGHTAGNRLLMFALKPAPIQITGLGFGMTTGLPTIDYRLTDPWVVKPNETAFHAEKPLYMDSAMHWSPPQPEWAPALLPPPVLAKGQVTLGYTNSFRKLNDTSLALWARILHQLPGSQLAFKNTQFDDPALQSALIHKFAPFGIGAERLQFVGETHPLVQLQFYNQIDIALDPFPFNGGITGCETLWMGVPFVTLACFGGTRTGESILHVCGHPEWIAHSAEDYLAKVLALAQDPQYLAKLKPLLRETLAQSAICETETFVRKTEAQYRDIWREWCDRNSLPL